MAELIERLQQALADRYRVERELGAGGMATVYLAEDLRHHRQVALKVLKPELAATLGSGRFAREIEVAARLQHPNILPLLDSGEAAGFFFYVMPYVEGESLRDRLVRGGELPIPDAVRILMEVADALSEAHAHGVVHRDIKPDNVMLRGRHAVVTDFGVAKAVTEATGRQVLTSTGIALGTPAYMAPEQATADPHQDHRVDLYALGVLGYELLTGRAPYEASTAAEMLAAHVTAVPEPLEKYRPTVPPALTQIILKCLAKKPADRWQSAEEVLQHLEPLATPSGGTTPTQTAPVAAPSPTRRWPMTNLVTGVVLTALVLVIVLLVLRRPAFSLALGHSEQVTAEPGLDIQPAISPDGKLVAYSAGSSLRMRVFIRPVGGGRVIPLSDDTTSVETQPRWSPDGSRLLFLTHGGVSVASALGGSTRPVVPPSPTASVAAATWAPDGTAIAFVRGDSLMVVGAGGGQPRVLSSGLFEVHSCAWSPRGKWIACVEGNSSSISPGTFFGNIAPSAILLFPAAGGPPLRLIEPRSSNQSPIWSADGARLLFVSNRDGPRDIYSLSPSSSGRSRGGVTRLTTGLGATSISLSGDGGRLAYAVYTARSNLWSLPVPHGAPVAATRSRATAITTGHQVIESVRVSRDGRWLVYDSDVKGNAEIYRVAVGGGQPEQLTSDPADEFAADLSPDGQAIAYHSWRLGARNIEVKPLNGAPVEQVTGTRDQSSYPVWSPDGQAILFYNQAPRFAAYIAHRGPSGSWGVPERVAEGMQHPEWSSDGREIAFSSGKGYFIVPSAGGTPRRVFAPQAAMPAPGTLVQWSPDGRTLYFKARDAQGRASFWSVDAAGSQPRLLVRFDDPDWQSGRDDFATDGRRFYFPVQDRQSDIYVADVKGE
jgi:eukaryotic-like serine/threonine-protein kinase